MQQWCLRCVRCAAYAVSALFVHGSSGACWWYYNAHAGNMTSDLYALAPEHA